MLTMANVEQNVSIVEIQISRGVEYNQSMKNWFGSFLNWFAENQHPPKFTIEKKKKTHWSKRCKNEANVNKQRCPFYIFN